MQLRASGIDTSAAIDERWRGNDRTTNALLAAYDAPVNSDYAPFLESNAARARFLGGGVSALFETQAPVPLLEMLGGGGPSAAPPLAVALADALAAPPDSTPALAPGFAAYADALRAARELLRTCRPGGPVPLLLEGAVGVAMEINRLPAARAGAAWTSVKSGPCYAHLDSGLRTWVHPSAAVGAGDANAMATLGARAALPGHLPVPDTAFLSFRSSLAWRRKRRMLIWCPLFRRVITPPLPFEAPPRPPCSPRGRQRRSSEHC